MSITPFLDLIEGESGDPFWLGNVEFHKDHQSNLVRKNYDFYYPKFKIEGNLPYIWPV